MKRFAVAMLAVVGISAPAMAGKLEDGLAACRDTGDEHARLSCYDLLVNTELPGMKTDPSSEGRWTHNVEKDPMTDFESSSWVVSADSKVPDQAGDAANPTFTIACRNAVPEIYVNWRRFITSGGVDSGTRVTFRVDAYQAVVTNWSMSSNFEATFSQDPSATARALRRGQRFLVSTTPHGDNEITASFDITGVDRVIEDVSKRCDWKP
jgi:hypothetical protein